MKLAIVLTIFSSYLLLNCEGLKCYDTGGFVADPSNVTTEECQPPFTNFCVTMKIDNGVDRYIYCGNEEFCTSKGCFNNMYCDEPGTFVRDHPTVGNATFTITCCDTDFCNINAVKSEKESSANPLYAISFISSTGFSLIFCLSFFFISIW